MEMSSFVMAVIEDLGADLDPQTRYARYVNSLAAALPGNACALLKKEGSALKPLVVRGLTPDSLGRRFELNEHPRLNAIVTYRGVTHFPNKSTLPDPYDGLLEGVHAGDLTVHDCMGCALHVNGKLWGAITLDSLKAGVFDVKVERAMAMFARLGEAVVHLAELNERTLTNLKLSQGNGNALQALEGVQLSRREMIGDSKPIRDLKHEILTVASSQLAVLIHGETGVGKELVAQALHAMSSRANLPLVVINCAALPDQLIESELFGHVKGAFSGAERDRQGKFELANEGTLFLDEVGELSASAQAKLLRVLQSGQVQRVGSDREHRVDVRIVAASNRDLSAEVKAGRFRADLYHRLCAYPLHIPPLRERGDDVVLLAGYFLEQNRSRLGLRNLRLGRGCEAALKRYNWPGNVRELEHTLGRAALKARRDEAGPMVTVELEHLDLLTEAGQEHVRLHRHPDIAMSTPMGGMDYRDAVDEFSRNLIQQVLKQTDDNRAAAARQLGLDSGNFHRMLKRLGI
ncbi:Nitric oxide reductase transcription regulator NorR2 [Limnobacter sp. 130]|uniref:nitric oxide reductase transcriptional regulator NorR n=1 Tax=Limnobacter sp. 130 TaxID=2653147 RepID=UPI0012F07EF7|nr:nitric oxide reductase transcriptional regulator NorR [Limnobacter sp. 130]VWX36050.1 Nitric oxide reductase transcription regulator NorR2 [Limnobacter sp. 130]